MQKKIIALAVAGLVSGAAFAQNNVTIYGLVDVGFEYGNGGTNAGPKFRIQSGQAAGSRLGFKGEEALGNGLSAIWTLEQGIYLDSGSLSNNGALTVPGGNNAQNGTVFQRQAWAGLKGNFGQVTIGRQYTPNFLVRANADVYGLGTAATAQNTWQNVVGTADRVNNAIAYVSPTFYGVTGAIAYSTGMENNVHGGQNGENDGQVVSLYAQYTGVQGLYVGYAYTHANGFNTTCTAAFASAANSNTCTAGTGANATGGTTLGDPADVNNHILGASYDFGVAKVFGSYTQGKATANTGNANITALDGNAWTLGAAVPFGAHKVSAQYGRFNNKLAGATANDVDNFGFGYNYAFSKRTDLYAAYNRTNNKGLAASAVNNALVQGLTTGAGVDPWAITAGIRHTF